MISEAPSSFLASRANRPAGMAPFDEAARQIAAGQWPKALMECERPVVAVVCNLTPLELIHAAGGVPVRLCAGTVADFRAAANLPESEIRNPNAQSAIRNPQSAIASSPRDLCQVVKGAAARLDALKAQQGRGPAAVVVPSTCDWKSRCCGFLGLGDEARVLEVPRDKSSDRARRDWRNQIAGLADFLARRTATAPSRASLLHSIALYQRAAALGRRLGDRMKLPAPPLAGAELMLVFNLFYSLPVETWIAAAAGLLKEIGDEGQAQKQAEADGLTTCPARLVIVGAPIIWPNWWLPQLVESLGGRIVADSLCSSYRGFSDLVSVDETTRPALLEALADRYLLPCTCPCFSPNEEYLWRAENLAADFRADGAIIHRLKNCYLFDLETQRLEDLFRARGLPSLTVESDYESPATAAAATRVEAFLEVVRHKTP